ncbi:ribosome-recycling factor [Emydomyces testavorans]|uniref:Ribosome-recycling factor n=1 Tax=Emydomyces testavorans TaxID=2070801 RepID=A0AAF0DK97_9EURO|nr:ribosome-recycling factor [Emydomyces testavorans]
MSSSFRIVSTGAARTICRRNGFTFARNHNSTISSIVGSTQPLRHHRTKFQLPSLNTQIPRNARLFSTSPALSRKKKDKSSHGPEESSSSAAAAGGGLGEDPFDFSQLSNGIQDAVARLKDDVSKLRAGGRLNPELIENVRVTLKTGSGSGKGGGKEMVKVGELAQVIPKGGRMIMILVGEDEYAKPITSALQAMPSLSLNPQPDPHNKLQLNVPIPPPTRESRDQALKDAKAAMERAAMAVKNARADVNKKLKALGNKKVVRPDDLRKALEQMEKVADKGQKEVKDVFEAAKKTLERE